MMGRTHAMSGVLLALVAVPLLPRVGCDPDDPLTVCAFAIACAGAAMLPDADHPSGSVAWTLPPVTKPLTRMVAALSGGHRHGTHSLIGVVGFTAFALLVGCLPPLLHQLGVAPAQPLGQALLGVWIGFLLAIGLNALPANPQRHSRAWTLVGVVGGATLALTTTLVNLAAGFVPLAVALGCLAHLAGDLLTKEGCPLLWPLSNIRFRVAAMTTGHLAERCLLAPLIGAAAVLLLLVRLGATGPGR
ncbi:LexA-binding, inner membrane-associated putative hydrolase [Propionibacterium cyclohexanicum]|uniref:LexA-binding, inner membrane-associated putative hydrolase n=1 Tax=Propionibacterium cyclohexanicum TaxID=64702 RepID=A0A1H9RAQ3_9ACTN|nr:metal-dependent hydrolase [Propionibacterium cyclohexanicum]SER69826.1 LexA-binding, inner membrane-associated putative hydrolase [Propionibacterium cyclohexanicum]